MFTTFACTTSCFDQWRATHVCRTVRSLPATNKCVASHVVGINGVRSQQSTPLPSNASPELKPSHVCLMYTEAAYISNVHCTPLWSCGKVFSWGINGLDILQFTVWVKFYCSSEGCIPYGSFAFEHVRRNPWVFIAFSQECGFFLVDWKATLGPHLLETLHNYTASLKCTCHKI